MHIIIFWSLLEISSLASVILPVLRARISLIASPIYFVYLPNLLIRASSVSSVIEPIIVLGYIGNTVLSESVWGITTTSWRLLPIKVSATWGVANLSIFWTIPPVLGSLPIPFSSIASIWTLGLPLESRTSLVGLIESNKELRWCIIGNPCLASWSSLRASSLISILPALIWLILKVLEPVKRISLRIAWLLRKIISWRLTASLKCFVIAVAFIILSIFEWLILEAGNKSVQIWYIWLNERATLSIEISPSVSPVYSESTTPIIVWLSMISLICLDVRLEYTSSLRVSISFLKRSFLNWSKIISMLRSEFSLSLADILLRGLKAIS